LLFFGRCCSSASHWPGDARTVGIVLACLSLIANFLFIPHYPIWSLIIIALDIAVIWALATYRREAL
jgi:hypothetical protein